MQDNGVGLHTSLSKSNVTVLYSTCSVTFTRQACYLVRTKSDVHIENYVRERHIAHIEARERYIAEARRDLDRLQQQSQIKDISLDLDDYLISSDGIRQVVGGQFPPNNIQIDEERFLYNLGVLSEASQELESSEAQES